jgi:transposase-like protein
MIPGALDPDVAAAAMAVLNGGRTVRDVGDRLRVRSTSTVYAWLCEARNAGLVTWENGRAGTLRPTIEAQPYLPRSQP